MYALPPITAQLASKVLSSVVSAINWKSSVTQCGNNNALGGVGPENSMEIYVLCLLVTSVVITNI